MDDVQVFARFEADGLAGRDGDLRSGAWVAAHTSFPGFDGEHPETAKFDAIAFDERLLHGVEDSVDGSFRLGADKSGAFDDALNEVLFDQLCLFSGCLRFVVGPQRLRQIAAAA